MGKEDNGGEQQQQQQQHKVIDRVYPARPVIVHPCPCVGNAERSEVPNHNSICIQSETKVILVKCLHSGSKFPKKCSNSKNAKISIFANFRA